MRILYVDNYRGFSNTYIPIHDVNFLVGENSTGKTSILSLIRLLASPFFWFDQDFNPEDIQLGSFKDIVSAEAKDKSYFRIGLISIDETNKKNKIENPYVFLMKFISHDGLPAINQYSYIDDQNAVTIKIKETKVSYAKKTIPLNKDITKEVLKTFKKWVIEDYSGLDFKDLTNQLSLSSKRSFVQKPAFLRSAVASQSKSSNKGISVQVPDFAQNLAWIAPIRSKPKRTYDQYKFDFSPEGEHAPYLIRKFFNDRKQKSKFKVFLTKFGNNSGMFNRLSIKSFGKTSESPFQLDVSLHNAPINIEYVGYGVSQSLPIIVELFARSKNSWYMIQQPEVHLHPRAQASLGNIFFHAAHIENKKFLIETHSDFTIDRYRVSVRKTKKVKHKSQILFFERDITGNKVLSIELDKNGNYPEIQPDSFRAFFIREEMNILSL